MALAKRGQGSRETVLSEAGRVETPAFIVPKAHVASAENSSSRPRSGRCGEERRTRESRRRRRRRRRRRTRQKDFGTPLPSNTEVRCTTKERTHVRGESPECETCRRKTAGRRGGRFVLRRIARSPFRDSRACCESDWIATYRDVGDSVGPRSAPCRKRSNSSRAPFSGDWREQEGAADRPGPWRTQRERG